MEGHRGSRPAAGGEFSGWIAFAGMLMLILGSLDALWGFAALLNNEIVVVGGRGALILDITTWGWIHLILGLLVALIGLGLITGNSAARVGGIFVVALFAVAQIVWFPAAPLWAFLMIILSCVILYQLMVNWRAD
jgi:hypothetical protein